MNLFNKRTMAAQIIIAGAAVAFLPAAAVAGVVGVSALTGILCANRNPHPHENSHSSGDPSGHRRLSVLDKTLHRA
jgi:hypothetical protein